MYGSKYSRSKIHILVSSAPDVDTNIMVGGICTQMFDRLYMRIRVSTNLSGQLLQGHASKSVHVTERLQRGTDITCCGECLGHEHRTKTN